MTKHNTPHLGKLKLVDLRKIWQHEAYDFTQWLAEEENLQALSDAIGLEINLLETEANVGRFNVDILAEEANTGRKIIIENQLETTDHDHLGKIITYASGYDAEIVIWIVKETREEHQQAINWLNEHTDDKTYFFLIKMEVWQIDDSAIAPRFNVIAQPNDWMKTLKTSKGRQNLTELKLLQQEYWTKLKEFANAHYNGKIRLGHRPRPQHWYNINIGRSGAHIALTLNKPKQKIHCNLYIPDNIDLFQQFYSQKDTIEKDLGYKLQWLPLDGKQASRIQVSLKADYQNTEDWNRQFTWLLEKAIDFRRIFGK